MKRLLCALVALFILTPAINSVSAQEDESFRFGFRAGYYYGENAIVGGAFGRYGVADWLNFEMGVNYVLKANSTVDVYAEYQIPLEITSYWYLYPLVGISVHNIDGPLMQLKGWTGGVNFGIGLLHDISDRWSVNFQGKMMMRFPMTKQSLIIGTISFAYNF